jgi:fibronectin type 3 domain-containing protein
MKQCETPVGDASPPADLAAARKSTQKKLSASFIDTLPSAVEREHPNGLATYAVEVLNRAGRGAGISNQVHVALVPTLPPFTGFNVRTTSKGVVISWECEAGARQGRAKYLFRIYRREDGKTGDARIAQVDATGCTARTGDESSFLDQSFEWEHTYFYRGTVVSVVEAAGKAPLEVEGEDTPEVKVFAHDIFPPAVPTGLQAVFSGAGQQKFVDLIWTPVTDADLTGYNVYRHEEGAPAVKLNAEPVKTPAFRDAQVAAARKYFYSVSAIDERGNESARSEEASERVP